MPNGGTRTERSYDMDRDSFTLLAMGFRSQRRMPAPAGFGGTVGSALKPNVVASWRYYTAAPRPGACRTRRRAEAAA
jgi:hypothetical protein